MNMSLAELSANKKIATRLKDTLDAGRLLHAYLFIGGAKSRLEIGREFAKAVLCRNPQEGDSCGKCLSCKKFNSANHEDFIFLNLENAPQTAKTQISKESIDYVQERLKLKPYGIKQLVLIDEAHLMNAVAQNMLLKTLEEPVGNYMIILLSESDQALFKTLQSRCTTYHLEPELPEMSENLMIMAEDFLELCMRDAPFHERLTCLSPILNEKGDQKGNAESFVGALQILLRDAIISRYGVENSNLLRVNWSRVPVHEYAKTPEKGFRAACDAIKSLKLGYNVRYTLKKLCLDM